MIGALREDSEGLSNNGEAYMYYNSSLTIPRSLVVSGSGNLIVLGSGSITVK
jgi:hypothetical protein